MAKGYLALVLHAHLPFVRHPEHSYSLEEKWYHEAVTETYIPLIWGLERLLNDGVPFKLTVSLSPTLLSMFGDPFLQHRYLQHLDRMLELADREVHRTRGTPYHETALMYHGRLHGARNSYAHRYGKNLILAFKKLFDTGRVELITSAATHGYLPFMMVHPAAVRAQIEIGVNTFRQCFDRDPAGLWLPECAYIAGLDEILREYNIRYFFTDTHGLLFASHRPRFGIFAPIYCPSGVAAFARDVESSKQVWSAKEGYPGDFDYREYYRDIGFDLDFEYVKPYIHPNGLRVHTGFKYYRITGTGNHKEPYVPKWARARVDEHAGNFIFNREHQVRYLSGVMDRPPLIVAPYDAELFGHWWFEGPEWLESIARKIAYDQDTVELTTPSEYLKCFPCNQVAVPCSSSWGNKGYHEVWLNHTNDWIYRHLHWAAEQMTALARDYPHADALERRALNQAARELLLAQASDWAFIMATDTMVEYAVRRTKTHLLNFKGLWHQVREQRIERHWLEELEDKNNIFPEIDYAVYAKSAK
ncbi:MULTISPECIES: glycoside hydrolase family 57 protein [Thermoanaerobacterales]|uniref:Glycoside hydrolase, family 57 n=1 Tax=Desulforudis audaxviator (strain MP104C) TaxID=477974 RepID=B1I3I5_DESAP|nr:1,4-alpha-glucan branching protein domain-containing protein [Candidatus Desulforudis audaxviator]ACA59557.1 glycoside hydrolase, family 57 [Candidatus Desulforudis audaxviator MP104C]AZK59541.1 Glycogen branching enzyme, GH-57-type, archaeal [Candidatus Desulforudis audaxviator]